MYTPNDSCSGMFLSRVHVSITASQPYTMTGVHYMATWHECVIRNHLSVIWNVHMLFFRAYTAMEKTNNARLYAVHVQPLAPAASKTAPAIEAAATVPAVNSEHSESAGNKPKAKPRMEDSSA